MPAKRTGSLTSKKRIANPLAETESKHQDDYIEIRLPKIRFQDTPLAPLWVILLLVFSFLLGATTTKLQLLQKETTSASLTTTQLTQQPKQQITSDTIKRWAKEIGLNTQQFNKCFDTNKYQAEIDRDIQDAILVKAEATPTFYINGRRIVGAQPYASFKQIIDQELKLTSVRKIFSHKAFAQEAISPLPSPTIPEVFEVGVGHLPVLGKPQAPVTMIEFSDFECPFCRRYFVETYPQIKKDYIDKGKVKFYYRHLPLDFHPLAKPFANASECANEQGKFWQMHDKIFKEQE
jgi:protein-disulfide isomerase